MQEREAIMDPGPLRIGGPAGGRLDKPARQSRRPAGGWHYELAWQLQFG
jgi:hypothetical protein